MAGRKARSVFVCQQCGNETLKWMGQCPSCGEWESLVEMSISTQISNLKSQSSKINSAEPILLSKIKGEKIKRRSTGFSELDRVLGGPSTSSGLVPGQVVLLAGEPGIGKSTLLLQVGAKFSIFNSQFSNRKRKTDVLYISGEESPGQIKIRAKRLGIDGKNIQLYAETNVERILDKIQNSNVKAQSSKLKTDLVIADSIQSLWSQDLGGIPGSVGQVRLCSQKLIEACKARAIPLFIVGQVTKEGTIAGPKVLEHAVDTVLYLEGERMEDVRLLRCFKNRFGKLDELAVFKMGETGLEEISDASKLFLEDEDATQPGAVLTPTVAGARVLLVELQSLVVPTKLVNPRRVCQGFPRARLEMITAILQKHLRIPLYKFDIFINVSGGISIEDPAADLAVALSIYSSLKNKALPVNSTAFGELSLLAGIRPVLREKQRREEAKRLGLKKIYSSKTSKYLPGIIGKIFS
jgi:DNA repair protein RadA/Sms